LTHDDHERFLRALPKAELHLHLEGSVAEATLAALARKHGIELPFAQIDELFQFDDLAEFLGMYDVVCDAMRDADDFRRTTYEALERVADSGGRYAELFFSPQTHQDRNGVPYARMLDGILAGMREAQTDRGVVARLIPAYNRELGPERGFEFVDMVLAEPRDEVIGIGLDYLENDPRPFAPMYERARRGGLHVTAHAGEIGPAAFVRESLDLLGCERIDHGYHVVDDPQLVERCRAAGTFFTACPTTTTYTTDWRDLTAPDHAIRRMLDSGLTLTLNTDDPGLMRTTLLDEYRFVAAMGRTPEQMGEIALNGLRASWLDPETKREWLATWSAEIERLSLAGAVLDG
jgi:adenosine deaminase